MPGMHVTELMALLKKSGLLTPSQWEAAQPLLRESATVDALCAELIKREFLTPWQAGQLQKGQTGFVLQQYQLQAPIGKGGMGHVFRAKDSRNGSVVAIKVMSRKLTGNQTLVNRFRREIRASSLLNSPNIVRTLDAGRVGKVDFMVMEYVNGDQLDRIVSRIPAMPVSIACDIIRQAAVGLQHAHEQKMVHRDIKPGNLIVDWSSDGRGTVKIMDMGLVRLNSDEEERTAVTRAGQVMGTPDYMSPEQGWDTATVDIRSDIYSLGCTFFRLLTGRVPFPGDNPLQVLMARCSKDAPSPRGLRPDLPEAVEAIVRRMTLRDPEGRFQTPAELAQALLPLCTPLNVESLRKAMKEAGADDAIVLDVASRHDVADPQDAGYQQFLKEMDSGAAVDLMMTTNPGAGQAMTPTLPVIPQVDRRLAGPRRPPRSRAAGVVAMASASAGVALLALFLYVNRAQPLPANPDPVDKKAKEVPTAPVATLATLEPITVRAGELMVIEPQFEGKAPDKPTAGKLIFQLGDGVPAEAAIDADSGKISWNIPSNQTAAAYEFPVQLLFENEGKTVVISEAKLVATVTSNTTRFSLPQAAPIVLKPGERFTQLVAASPEPPAGAGFQYRLGRDALPEMRLEPSTGNFEWTPGDDDAGKHVVTVELLDSSSRIAATGTLTLLVRPGMMNITLPQFPEQTVKAGEVLTLQLFERTPRILGRVIRIRTKEGSPPGVILDVRRGMLRWPVPKTATGRYEITVVAEPILPEIRFANDARPQTVIVVNVSPSVATVPASKTPPEKEVEKAENELRDLYKKDLATARSVSERATLARRLLEKSFGQTPGATDFALLELSIETAEKARATDVLLEAFLLREDRYGVEELADATRALEECRSASLSPAAQDRVIEHGVRLAQEAVESQQWATIKTLVGPANDLVKKSAKGTPGALLSQDLTQALKVADDLTKSGSQASDLKRQELQTAVSRWQFDRIFEATEDLAYVQTTESVEPFPDSGAGVWKLEPDRLRLAASARKADIGLIDSSFESGRWLFRCQILGTTTSAMVFVGVGREEQVSGHLISLEPGTFGRVTVQPGGTELQSLLANPPWIKDGWNDIEVFADGPALSLRLNGTQQWNIQAPQLRQGRFGLLVSLQKAGQEPVFEMRRPRVLVLP